MATAVVRVLIDAASSLSIERYRDGVARLRALGHDVVSSPAESLPEKARVVELVVEGDANVEACVADCAQAFGTGARLGVVTYISRGTDDDARGVLRRFGLSGEVSRVGFDSDQELVTVTIAPAMARRVPESRLHTALEAALNCDVRIIMPTTR